MHPEGPPPIERTLRTGRNRPGPSGDRLTRAEKCLELAGPIRSEPCPVGPDLSEGRFLAYPEQGYGREKGSSRLVAQKHELDWTMISAPVVALTAAPTELPVSPVVVTRKGSHVV